MILIIRIILFVVLAFLVSETVDIIQAKYFAKTPAIHVEVAKPVPANYSVIRPENRPKVAAKNKVKKPKVVKINKKREHQHAKAKTRIITTPHCG